MFETLSPIPTFLDAAIYNNNYYYYHYNSIQVHTSVLLNQPTVDIPPGACEIIIHKTIYG